MKFRFQHWLLSAIFLVILFLFTNSARAEENEIWTSVSVDKQWKNIQWSLTCANFFYPTGSYFHNHTQLDLEFPSKNNFYLGLGYKQEYVKLENHFREEHRPMFLLFYKKQMGMFEFRDRSRFELRFVEKDLLYRYRNQIQLSYTKNKKVTPYVSTESNFYFNKFEFTRQRTTIGTKFLIHKTSLNLFFIHQINKQFNDIWANRYMMGTSVSFGL